MVYGMLCYNLAISNGSMKNQIFLEALYQLPLIGIIAFIIEFFIVEKIATKISLNIVNPQKENPFYFTIVMSCASVMMMCPIMSFITTILFKHAGTQIIAVWLQSMVFSFPMALLWSIFYAGPLTRFIFNRIFKNK